MNTAVLNGLAYAFELFSSYGILRALIEGAIVVGLWLGLQRTTLSGRARIATWLAIAVPLLAWFAVVFQLARSGALPSIPLLIVVPVAVGLALLMRSQRVAEVLDATPPTWLVGLQVYRVFGATFLVQWGLGHLNGVFAVSAGVGDVLVGVLALPAVFYLRSGARGGRAIAVTWNLLGIFDLVVAVTLGILSQSGLLHSFGVQPTPLGYPLVMIPAFAVPQALILHGLSLWQLRRGARRLAAAATPAPPFKPSSASAAAA